MTGCFTMTDQIHEMNPDLQEKYLHCEPCEWSGLLDKKAATWRSGIAVCRAHADEYDDYDFED